MHQSDRVRLQFGMHQPIPDPPTDLGRWHIKRVNNQWDHADYRTFAPEFCEMWKQRRTRLLQFPVAQLPMFPTAEYVSWFRTVTTPDMYVSDPYYLHDPRQQQYAQQPPQQPPQQRQQRRQRQTSKQPYHEEYQTTPITHYQSQPIQQQSWGFTQQLHDADPST